MFATLHIYSLLPFGKNHRANRFALYTRYTNTNNPTLKNISASKCPARACLYTLSNSFFAFFALSVAESNPLDKESMSFPRRDVSSPIELDIRFNNFTFCRKVCTPSSYSKAGWPSCTETSSRF